MRIFVTFANTPWRAARARILRQAERIGFYDRVHGFDEHGLDEAFRMKYSEQLLERSRGYGYWCWKPQVILQVLERMDEGDILQYTDAGCHLNPAGEWRLAEYFEMAERSATGIVAFQGKPPAHPLPPLACAPLDLTEYRWVKGDLLDHLGVRGNSSITHTQTIGAGIIFVRKCPRGVALMREWAAVIADGFRFIDDSPSKSPNLPGFVEHRHDQAIFSLLCKKHGVETLSAYEYWYPKRDGKTPDWEVLRRYPIHARHDKGLTLERLVSRVKEVGRDLFGTARG
jgi:hypothetical protein